MTKVYIISNLSFIIIVYLLFSCSEDVKISKNLNIKPDIFPDYKDVNIPVNISPLHFMLPDTCNFSDAYATFSTDNKSIKVEAKDNQFGIDASDWKELLADAAGEHIKVDISAKKDDIWCAFAPFNIYVSKDSIDPYIAYRLIEPGYEKWYEMGIYQRCLENYDENAIITNKQTDHNCMNCHSFCMQSPDTMLFHMRMAYGATYIINGNRIEKLNTKTDKTISALVYPSWHPSGNFVAFSVNLTKQMFHTTSLNRVEVFDYASDVVVYDVKEHRIITSPHIFSNKSFETFPTFSADGKTLFFCTADSVKMPENYNKVKYSICSISFDPRTKTFGNDIDTIYNAKSNNKSASFPRVSPDGKFLMFALSDYGNFSIWHKDADLFMICLQTRKLIPLNIINSNDAESYHSWSSNSRWVIFSSRRIDGLYTRPFIAHIDANGKASKPFLLPQNDIDYYKHLFKSYNIPEFIKGAVKMSTSRISREAHYGKSIDIR